MEDYIKALEAVWIQILLLNAKLPLSLNLLVDEMERCRKLSLPAPAAQSEPIIASCNDHSGDGEVSTSDSINLWKGPSSVTKEDDGKRARRTWSSELQGPSSEPREEDGKKTRGTWSPELHGPPSEPKEEDSKKVRRNWSAELQSMFHVCVGQLGGPQAAEPKRLLELMNVNGLTKAEVSSRHAPSGSMNMMRTMKIY